MPKPRSCAVQSAANRKTLRCPDTQPSALHAGRHGEHRALPDCWPPPRRRLPREPRVRRGPGRCRRSLAVEAWPGKIPGTARQLLGVMPMPVSATALDEAHFPSPAVMTFRQTCAWFAVEQIEAAARPTVSEPRFSCASTTRRSCSARRVGAWCRPPSISGETTDSNIEPAGFDLERSSTG